MTILIDDRIGAKELYRYLDAPVIMQRLEFADACFIGCGPGGIPSWIGVERKRVGDLISSIDSGRLAGHQLIGLMNSYHEVYLLIEGIWRMGSEGEIQTYHNGKRKWCSIQQHGNSNWTFRSVTKYINTLMVTMGVKVWMTGTLKESAQYLTYLYNWWQIPYDKHTSLHQFHKVQRPVDTLIKPSFLRRACAELEGIGWKRSATVASYFKTMENLVNATEKELLKVEGIGKKTAAAIRKELHT